MYTTWCNLVIASGVVSWAWLGWACWKAAQPDD